MKNIQHSVKTRTLGKKSLLNATHNDNRLKKTAIIYDTGH